MTNRHQPDNASYKNSDLFRNFNLREQREKRLPAELRPLKEGSVHRDQLERFLQALEAVQQDIEQNFAQRSEQDVLLLLGEYEKTMFGEFGLLPSSVNFIPGPEQMKVNWAEVQVKVKQLTSQIRWMLQAVSQATQTYYRGKIGSENQFQGKTHKNSQDFDIQVIPHDGKPKRYDSDLRWRMIRLGSRVRNLNYFNFNRQFDAFLNADPMYNNAEALWKETLANHGPLIKFFSEKRKKQLIEETKSKIEKKYNDILLAKVDAGELSTDEKVAFGTAFVAGNVEGAETEICIVSVQNRQGFDTRGHDGTPYTCGLYLPNEIATDLEKRVVEHPWLVRLLTVLISPEKTGMEGWQYPFIQTLPNLSEVIFTQIDLHDTPITEPDEDGLKEYERRTRQAEEIISELPTDRAKDKVTLQSGAYFYMQNVMQHTVLTPGTQ